MRKKNKCYKVSRKIFFELQQYPLYQILINQFYFKTTQEMSTLFKDIPQAIENTQLIVDKVKPLKLEREILLPFFKDSFAQLIKLDLLKLSPSPYTIMVRTMDQSV